MLLKYYHVAVHLAVDIAVYVSVQIFSTKGILQLEPQHGLQVGVSVVKEFKTLMLKHTK